MLIKMYHDDPAQTGGPTTADVPEEQVKAWRKYGWYEENEKNEVAPRERRVGRPPKDAHGDMMDAG